MVLDQISLRPVTAEDESLLIRLYGSTRADELAQVPWTDEQREAFIRFQYTAQIAYYQQQFPDAVHSVIVCDGQAAGRLYLHRRIAEIRILDIIVAPELRGRGIGQAVLAPLMSEAALSEKPLTIHIEPYNPICRLFERLGFRKVTDGDAIALFEWRSPTILPDNAT
jgi:RimJ/RimL family protein N-acetyltransferase